MPKRSSTPPNDENQAAFEAVKRLTDQSAASEPQETDESSTVATPEKNPHAQALGRLGGLKGGKARAKKLSKKRRAEIARRAARARWKGES